MAAYSDDQRAVSKFIEYLQIRTVHPKPDYAGAIAFLKGYVASFGFSWTSFEFVAGKPIAIATWKGRDESLESILLNSHMDVVPAVLEHWKWDPFAAKTENGIIYARGTQDMKCVGIQHLEACGRLKAAGFQPLRTIHISFVPDEEIGGADGMKIFVQSEQFKALRVGLALDEGLASPTDAFKFYYGERAPWWIKITCRGRTGHGSQFIEDTAAEKLNRILNKFLALREEHKLALHKGHACGIRLGNVTSVNLSYLKGGVSSDGKTFQMNIVPGEFEAGFDIRIPPSVDLAQFKKQIDEWCDAEGAIWELLPGSKSINALTELSDSNVWWTTARDTFNRLSLKIETEIFPAGTDSAFIRAIGIPAFGFSPMNNTPVLLHDHNECLSEAVFLRGISIFMELIRDLANIPKF